MVKMYKMRNLIFIAFFAFVACKKEVVLPNAISPNGDGINDCFAIGKTGEFTSCTTVEIHNRWGNKIWSTTSTNKCWEGKDDKGNAVPEGTYFYILEFKDKKYTGHVMVVR